MKRSIIYILAMFIVTSINIIAFCEATPEVVTIEPISSKKTTLIYADELKSAGSPEVIPDEKITAETETIVATEETIIVTPEETSVVTEETAVSTVETISSAPDAEFELISEEVEEIELYFNDVPEKHWATKAVNDLVKLGITRGYPDGTYRGNNPITRYEAAVFLSKMAHKTQMRRAIHEKTLEELKSEIYKIRYTLDMYKEEPIRTGPVYGSVISGARFGNLVAANGAYKDVAAPIGPKFDYRLKTSFKQEFKGGTYAILSLDTMDAGYSVARDFAREMLDFEAGVIFPNYWGLRVTAGPGKIVHREPGNLFPSEDNTVYLRPSNAFEVYYESDVFESGFTYSVGGITTSGAASSHNIGLNMGYDLRSTFVGTVQMGYSINNFAKELRGGLATQESTINMYKFAVRPNVKNEFGLKFGASSPSKASENTYLNGYYINKGLLGKGSRIKMDFHKIGAMFLNAYEELDQDDILGVNLFSKLYKNSTQDMGIELSQKVAHGRGFRLRMDIVTDEKGVYGEEAVDSEATLELNMDFGINEDAVMTVGYRIYQKPSLSDNTTSDILGIGCRFDY